MVFQYATYQGHYYKDTQSMITWKIGSIHRVSIERKSHYKESYTVNSHRKSFDDVMGDVRACLRIQISR